MIGSVTPSDLFRAVEADLPSCASRVPSAILRAAEAAAEQEPRDRRIARLVDLAQIVSTAEDGLPAIVGGVRRERLVRADLWTVTVYGVDVASGKPALVRTLRPALAKDPAGRRLLRRDGRALVDIERGVVWDEQPNPAIKRILPGDPLDVSDSDDAGALIRAATQALVALGRWERFGVAPPRLEPVEWVRTPGGVSIATLTPGTPDDDVRDALSDVAGLLLDGWTGSETAIHPWLAGLRELPPHTASEAGKDLVAALAQALRRTRIHLATAGEAVLYHDAHVRLALLLERLVAAVPPPTGIGAVGIDIGGGVRVVRSDGREVRWGVSGQDDVVIRGADGDVAAAEARRLLRTRAAAPPNPRLQQQIGGDEAFTEAICRWVASAHGARTIRLLLRAA